MEVGGELGRLVAFVDVEEGVVRVVGPPVLEDLHGDLQVQVDKLAGGGAVGEAAGRAVPDVEVVEGVEDVDLCSVCVWAERERDATARIGIPRKKPLARP